MSKGAQKSALESIFQWKNVASSNLYNSESHYCFLSLLVDVELGKSNFLN